MIQNSPPPPHPTPSNNRGLKQYCCFLQPLYWPKMLLYAVFPILMLNWDHLSFPVNKDYHNAKLACPRETIQCAHNYHFLSSSKNNSLHCNWNAILANNQSNSVAGSQNFNDVFIILQTIPVVLRTVQWTISPVFLKLEMLTILSDEKERVLRNTTSQNKKYPSYLFNNTELRILGMAISVILQTIYFWPVHQLTSFWQRCEIKKWWSIMFNIINLKVCCLLLWYRHQEKTCENILSLSWTGIIITG